MNKDLFLELASHARSALQTQDIKTAIEQMESMLYLLPDSKIESDLNELSNAYEGLLNCIRKGFKDESREQAFHQMLNQSWTLFFTFMHKFECEQTSSAYRKANDHTFFKMPFSMLSKELEATTDTPVEHTRHYTFLFEQIWTTTSFSAKDHEDLQEMMDNESISLEDKLLAISALTLSALKYPECEKAKLLTELCQSTTPEIQARAMVGMILLTYLSSNHTIYDEVVKQFGQFMTQTANQDKLCTLIRAVYNAIDTDNFSQYLHEKVLPQLREQQDTGIKINGDMNNPQFAIHLDMLQNQMQNSTRVLEDLAKKGKDLYFGVFRNFKRIPFFRNPANWFYPFSQKHQECIKTFKEPTFWSVFFDQCPFCDSDKWSVFFITKQAHGNFKLDPETASQTQVIPPAQKPWDIICFNYMHDLYRFYKLYPDSKSCPNPFLQDVNPSHYTFLIDGLDNEHKLKMAYLLLENKKYQSAIHIFTTFQWLSLPYRRMLAYCYMKQGDYEQAIACYLDCMAEKETVKTQKRLIFCYQKAGYWQKADFYLKNLSITDKENALQYDFQRAICQINMENYEEALKLLYKIEFLQCNHPQAIQQIIWCNLKLKFPEKSLQYWQKIEKKTAKDWLNGGHIYWAANDIKNAYCCYQKYFSEQKNKDEATRIFLESSSILTPYQIGKTDILLMRQALGC